MSSLKILFICGCLEPGRDGVGDYTRRLSGELNRKGYESSILAIKDSFLKEPVTEIHKSENSHIPVLRIPAEFENRARYQKAQVWIEEHNFEWISLQFVPYSFNKKGIPWTLPNNLRRISRGRKWHIMFHELWIGMETNADLKDRFIGFLQRKIVKSIRFTIHPSVVHTQTGLYRDHLDFLGYETKYLPLFSNIPMHKDAKINKRNYESILKEKEIRVLFFGGIHKDAPISQFITELANFRQRHGFKISIITLGRNGAELEKWMPIWQSHGFMTKNLGEQPAEFISEIMTNSTFGVTTTPQILTEKSGSVAAMLAHDLPVLCVSKPWIPRGTQMNIMPEIASFSPGNLEEALSDAFKRRKKAYRVSEVANEFICALQKTYGNGLT